MKRIAEMNQKGCYLYLDSSKEYLNELKSASQARYSSFIAALKG